MISKALFNVVTIVVLALALLVQDLRITDIKAASNAGPLDLCFESVKGYYSNIRKNEALAVFGTVVRSGDRAPWSTTEVVFYHTKTNVRPNLNATPVLTESLDFFTTEKYEFQVAEKFDKNGEGTEYVWAHLDNGNKLNEPNEENNWIGPIAVNYGENLSNPVTSENNCTSSQADPDPTPQSPQDPIDNDKVDYLISEVSGIPASVLSTNSDITANISVKNIGKDKITTPFKLTAYYSEYSAVDITSGLPLNLRELGNVSVLGWMTASRDTSRISLKFTMPKSGYVFFKIDSGNEIDEKLEHNNAWGGQYVKVNTASTPTNPNPPSTPDPEDPTPSLRNGRIIRRDPVVPPRVLDPSDPGAIAEGLKIVNAEYTDISNEDNLKLLTLSLTNTQFSNGSIKVYHIPAGEEFDGIGHRFTINTPSFSVERELAVYDQFTSDGDFDVYLVVESTDQKYGPIRVSKSGSDFSVSDRDLSSSASGITSTAAELANLSATSFRVENGKMFITLRNDSNFDISIDGLEIELSYSGGTKLTEIVDISDLAAGEDIELTVDETGTAILISVTIDSANLLTESRESDNTSVL